MKKTYIAPEAKTFNITKASILASSDPKAVNAQGDGVQLVNEERGWSSSGSSVWDTEW